MSKDIAEIIHEFNIMFADYPIELKEWVTNNFVPKITYSNLLNNIKEQCKDNYDRGWEAGRINTLENYTNPPDYNPNL